MCVYKLTRFTAVWVSKKLVSQNRSRSSAHDAVAGGMASNRPGKPSHRGLDADIEEAQEDSAWQGTLVVGASILLLMGLLGLFLRIRHNNVADEATGDEAFPIVSQGLARGADDAYVYGGGRGTDASDYGARHEQMLAGEHGAPDVAVASNETAPAGSLGMGACFPPTGPESRALSAWESAEQANRFRGAHS